MTDHSFAGKSGCSRKHLPMMYCNTITISRTLYKDATLILHGDHLDIHLLQNYVKQTDISNFHFPNKCELSPLGMIIEKRRSEEQRALVSHFQL